MDLPDTTPPDAESDPILLVEDDLVLAGSLERYLRARGHGVVRAESAEGALDLLRSGTRPSLVLLDINLPGRSGWAVLRDPAYTAAGSPPVLVATAIGIRPETLADHPIAGYLPKPFPLPTFIDAVERIIRRQGAAPTAEEIP